MKLDIFTNTVIKIALGSFAALTVFALVAGQSAHAGEPTETVLVQTQASDVSTQATKERFSRSVELLTQLEQDLLNAKAQMKDIELGFEQGKFSHQDLLFSAVTYFNIESAVIDARVQMMLSMNELKEQQNKQAYESSKASQLALTERFVF